MANHIALVAYLVRDYDEALAWFKTRLRFSVFEDTALNDGKRWVVMGPHAERGAQFLLARAATPKQVTVIGNAAGGRVAYFLHTDDFARDHKAMSDAGVRFLESPRAEVYGIVAVFEDLYGNQWDLIEPKIELKARNFTQPPTNPAQCA